MRQKPATTAHVHLESNLWVRVLLGVVELENNINLGVRDGVNNPLLQVHTVHLG